MEIKMSDLQKKSSAIIIVIHEIYGVNPHIQDFCQFLKENDYDVICPDLLNRNYFDYSQEEMAYRNFIDNIGFAEASVIIKNVISSIKRKYEKIFIAGFSVGATVAWLCSEEESVSGVIGYYGSRIRNHLEINPSCPTLLFFPQEEQSFQVDELISKLVQKDIGVHQLQGKHGFMDKYSVHYNGSSSRMALSMTLNFLRWEKSIKL